MKRFRNLKKSRELRDLTANIHLHINNFIQPYFVVEGTHKKEEITMMPGQYRFSVDLLLKEIEGIAAKGVRAILLFGIPEHKDATGSEAYSQNGIIQHAIRTIKQYFPELLVVTDLCMCEYTESGHCGIIKDGFVDNDATLPFLQKIALAQAEAGSDMIAPSDMMDGRIGSIRETLDGAGFYDLPVMSYSIKYASAYYGPFREAAGSAPKCGDRKSYQMDYRRSDEYRARIMDDISNGADIVMVKPALAYMDIIKTVKKIASVPVAAYNVSGEYAMVKAAAALGAIDEKNIVLENMYALKRAGADIIISYHTKALADWIK